MKYLILICLFLTACSTPKYCGIETYPCGVVTYKPNPNIINGQYNTEFSGEYYCQGFYEPIMMSPPFGPKGWEQGFDYPYTK
jgi:hypothetical protein